MAKTFQQQSPREALAAIAHDFHARGWMAGTAGNLSVRSNSDDGCFWITSSGQPKGCLDNNDFILVEIAADRVVQRLREDAKPSAETSIHRVIYRLFPDTRACLHVHTVDACLASNRIPVEQTSMPLPPLEMLKGLGIWEQDPGVSLALFDNLLEVPKIATAIEERFRMAPPEVPALMIRNHGITVWGESLQQAYNRVEIVEFIMSYLARQRQ